VHQDNGAAEQTPSSPSRGKDCLTVISVNIFERIALEATALALALGLAALLVLLVKTLLHNCVPQ
jgi:hypothetical protein